ncbi:hypothetical protein MPH_12193 [Macrophomina phaseolina MS6]|uniref:Uncharacterized protein n=1 Tax=Macrophomina phaseolina (strain MS6) TaxID=1126212 RepID=K2RKN3_MACPH|nr:hypothetical protein MPH_12193 [Macrophomina phaseolina MS6]
MELGGNQAQGSADCRHRLELPLSGWLPPRRLLRFARRWHSLPLADRPLVALPAASHLNLPLRCRQRPLPALTASLRCRSTLRNGAPQPKGGGKAGHLPCRKAPNQTPGLPLETVSNLRTRSLGAAMTAACSSTRLNLPPTLTSPFSLT